MTPAGRSALEHAVDASFAAGGALACADPLYTPRRVQLEMAQAVAAAIESPSS